MWTKMHAAPGGIVTPVIVRQVEGVQPMVTIEDCVEAEEIVKADPGIKRLLKDRYEISDMDMVAADPWYYGDRFGTLSVLLLFALHWESCSAPPKMLTYLPVPMRSRRKQVQWGAHYTVLHVCAVRLGA